jgi:uncharacterized protein
MQDMKESGATMQYRISHLRQAMLGLGLAALIGAMVVGMTGPAAAQDGTPTPSTDRATVSVNGHGSVAVAPDTASVTVGVSITDETLAGAQATASERMAAILDTLREQGVANEDIQTVNYSVNVIQNFDSQGLPSDVSQFQVSNQVNVTIRQLDQVGPILDAAVEAGANSIYGVNFYVEDTSAVASEARQLAVQDAQARAEELAGAAGLSVGSVISITETYGPSPMPLGRGGSAVMAESADLPIEAGSTVITVDVVVVYELV